MFRYQRLPTFVGVGLLAALVIAVLAFLAASSFGPRTADADPHPGQSEDVVIIGGSTLDPTCSSSNATDANVMDWTGGGCLPLEGAVGELGDFTFTPMEPAAVSAASLAPFDTAVLNVASDAVRCNTNVLSPTAQADLIAFVGSGNKLIIYDSECFPGPVDYSWLPFPFTTSNPGALGEPGTLTIVEDNTLSTDTADPSCAGGDPHCIDVANLGPNTDAVGDMNVMTTFDPNWCLDMSGTNAAGVTGPVHTYAKYPKNTDAGLIIYNGLDQDYQYGDDPDLRKMWVQELQQPFNPSGLPCGFTVVGISLTPETATNDIGTSHTVTATVTDLLGDPIEGVEVLFEVTDGPNAGATGTCSANADCTTDANGQVSFTYTDAAGNVEDPDTIEGCFLPEQDEVDTMPNQMVVEPELACDTATKEWVEPEPEPTPTPTPTAVAEAVELPTTGGAPSDGGSSALPWLAAIAGAIAVTSAGGFWFAYQRRRVR
jgi:hypothetical protein